MKLFEIRKIPGERQKRVSLSVFTTEWPALSDGQMKLYTDYHVIDKHEVTSLCGVPKGKKRWRGRERQGCSLITTTVISISPSISRGPPDR